MSTIKTAAFRLADFKINSFNFINDDKLKSDEIIVDFLPKGEFDKKKNRFNLHIEFKASNDKTKEDFLQVNIVGIFVFENIKSMDDIPAFFYKNAIAILYPYLRAFVSNVTLQANIMNLILPTMNLSALEPVLKESITEL